MSTLDVETRALVARTVRGDPAGERIDPIDRFGPDGFVWQREGVGFVTGGVAARVPARRVDDALAGIEVRDDVGQPGTGAIAVGSLPFLGAAEHVMTIPAWVEGRATDGSAWRTEIGPGDRTRVGTPDPATAVDRSGPGATRAECLTTSDAWRRAVDAALAEIRAGRVEKVVLARAVRIEAERRIDPVWLLRRLAAREPGRFLFATDRVVGASPELLVRRAGSTVTARPLAGSIPDPHDADDLDRLARSAKDQHEHRLVVDAIARELARSCTTVAVGATTPVPLADVAHLSTTIRAVAGPDTPSALSLALALHPTPAVGGTPTDAALALIERWEPHGRGHYAGPVGWVDARGDGELAVALRSAEIVAADGRRALVRAGAGIVAGSKPELEWAEVDAKLTPVLRALTAP